MTMTTTTAMNARQLAEQMKAEILEDVESGRVPATVGSFSELHDYVDANCYGNTESLWGDLPVLPSGEVDETARDGLLDLMNAAMAIVDQWIKSGAVKDRLA